MRAVTKRRLAAMVACVMMVVLCMSVPASALELDGETLPDLPVISGYKYVTVFDYYGYGAFYHNQETLTITGNSIQIPDAVLYRFSGETWYLSGEERTWPINTSFCPLLYSDVPVMYDNGTAFYMPSAPEPTQEPTPDPTPTPTQLPTPNMSPSSMSMFFKGAGYGMAVGTLAWFAGWLINKVMKLFQYVAR